MDLAPSTITPLSLCSAPLLLLLDQLQKILNLLFLLARDSRIASSFLYTIRPYQFCRQGPEEAERISAANQLSGHASLGISPPTGPNSPFWSAATAFCPVDGRSSTPPQPRYSNSPQTHKASGPSSLHLIYPLIPLENRTHRPNFHIIKIDRIDFLAKKAELVAFL